MKKLNHTHIAKLFDVIETEDKHEHRDGIRGKNVTILCFGTRRSWGN